MPKLFLLVFNCILLEESHHGSICRFLHPSLLFDLITHGFFCALCLFIEEAMNSSDCALLLRSFVAARFFYLMSPLPINKLTNDHEFY
jgi:hypothetical protein